ncbi:putative nucleotidyltransferase [Neisseria sp. HSC-16F19]|nr:nucleotidyltransferase domain-containing protein [Neisseria sp. HSC-16F19]MCP2041710.1 putative nucleotidyltransferase [Neisseria sp. HSC-16F19]
MNPTDLDMAPEALHIVRQILQQHIPQYEVRAFGSRVKGSAKPYSDLDLAVMTTDRPLSLQEHADLTEAFSASDLPWKVDLVDWQLLDEAFRQVIAERYIVLQAA